IDQEMKVSGVGFLRSRGRNPHSVEPKMDPGLRTNHRAVLEIKELGLRARRRGSWASCLSRLGIGGGGESKPSEQRDRRQRIDVHADLPARAQRPRVLDDLSSRAAQL